MDRHSRIYVAGHRGLVGSALVRRLAAEGFSRVITRTRAELDLLDQAAVARFFDEEKPEYVFLAAAKVGGIHANDTYPAEFIHQNLTIQNHVIHQSWVNGVEGLLFLGSSCIYPKHCPQPMEEGHLLTGELEPTNEPYAVAKIAGIKMCEAYNRQYGTRFVSVMPTNLYGPNDNFDLENSHVLPALIRKFHLARLASQGRWDAIEADIRRFGPIPADIRKGLGLDAAGNQKGRRDPVVVLWGSGSPRREFLHVDDLADACLFVMGVDPKAMGGPRTAPLVNVGCGRDDTIRELAELVADCVGYRGEVRWDDTKPDGTPRKLLDVSRLRQMGWQANISLADGIRDVYEWYRNEGTKADVDP